MTVQEGVTLQSVVDGVQHKSHSGGAEGLLGNTRVTVATCYWSSSKGGKDRKLVFGLRARGRKQIGWSGLESAIELESVNGSVVLKTENEPDLRLHR